MATKPKLPSNLKVSRDSLADLKVALAVLAEREVLVGFPEDTSQRKEDPADAGITNAALGYIHDNGDSDANIPARPFMIPGMESAIPQATSALESMAKRVLTTRSALAVEQGFIRLGVVVQAAIRKKLNEGIPPPLSARTLQARARKGRKGAKAELENRAKGLAPSTQLAKPLIDSAQMRNAINFVIRPRSRRR